MVQAEMQNSLQSLTRQLQSSGISLEQWLSATGQDPQQLMESTRPQAEQAVRTDLALRAVAKAEQIDADDGDIELEYARMAYQFGQKAKEIRRIYERNDAVPELVAQIRKQKAMDWLLHHVEMVDHDGNPVDRDLVLGHTHDHDGDEHAEHDHADHDHADHDHADHDHDHDDATGHRPAAEGGAE
jgi:trigger factor